jgi:hypothetical protein
MATYTDVQFIGYAIPSIPRVVADIADPNGPGFVEGRYIGIDPADADIDARIDLTMNALRQTLESDAVDASATTLKIFIMPEFTFRGKRGAYNNDPPAVDYFTQFRTQFAKHVAEPVYQGWLFVFGTTVNTAGDYVPGQDPKRDLKARVREDMAMALANMWQFARAHHDPAMATFVFNTLVSYTQYCRTDPVYEITNKSYVVAGGTPDAGYAEGLSVEKKFISAEDFVLNLYSNAFAEENQAYPDIDEKNGEDKQTAFDDLSIFTIQGIKFGLEVCLDHYRARLRRNRTPDTELVQIHLIPSCGMQIAPLSVVAGAGGLVFNCDGQYDLDPGSQPEAANSIWTGTASHRAHTQLTQVVTHCTGNDPTCNPPVLTKPNATVTTVPIDDPTAPKLFAYGAGEVHVYTPLPVPPGVGGGG